MRRIRKRRGIKSEISEHDLSRAVRALATSEYEAVQLYRELAEESKTDMPKRALNSMFKEGLVHLRDLWRDLTGKPVRI